MDLGRDIYMGWVAGVLALAASVCLFMSSCGNEEDEYETYETTQYSQGQGPPYNSYAESQKNHV